MKKQKQELKLLYGQLREDIHNKSLMTRIRKQKGIHVKRSSDAYYIIKREDPHAGIFSYILTFLSHLKYAEEKGYIPFIDMMNFKNAYLYPDEIGKKNAWEFYFEQPVLEVTLEQAYGSSQAMLSKGEFKSGYKPSEEFLENKWAVDSREWQRLFHKYIRLKPDVKERMENRYKEEFAFIHRGGAECLGVLCRGTDYFHFTESQSVKFDRLEIVINRIQKLRKAYGIDMIFLATEDERILELFIHTFRDSLIYNRRENRLSGQEKVLNSVAWQNNFVNLQEKGFDYILNLYVLSKCSCFIGARTSASVFLPLTANFKYSFYYDLKTIEQERFDL